MSRYIQVAIEVAGGEGRGQKTRAAKAFGISLPYLLKMLKEGRVPAERCRAIEAATGGKVTAEQLRPEIFGRPDSGRPPNKTPPTNT